LDYFPSEKQLLVVEIPDPRAERKYQQMHQGKDIIGETRDIGLMLPDFQITFVVPQAIEYIG